MIKAIEPNQLLTHMRAAQFEASQKNSALSIATAPEAGRVDFTGLMKNAVDKVNATQKASSQLKTAFEMGDPNVSLADTMIASQKASVAFEATLQVRNKFIKAYEEVMRMSV